MIELDLREGLYRVVKLCKECWPSWEKFNSPMISNEVFRVTYLLMCLQPGEERDRGIQIIKGHKPLYKKVKERLEKVTDNHYHIPAKPTIFTDRWGRKVTYASALEARMARILDRDNIEFTPHVKFDGLLTPDKKEFTYKLDFLFFHPQKFIGVPNMLNGIEVKGALSKHDIVRGDALEYFKGIKVWIILEPMIDFWEREGLHGNLNRP